MKTHIHTHTYIFFSLFSRDSLSGSVLFTRQAVNRHFQRSRRQASKSAKLPKNLTRAEFTQDVGRFVSTYAFAGSEVKPKKKQKTASEAKRRARGGGSCRVWFWQEGPAAAAACGR